MVYKECLCSGIQDIVYGNIDKHWILNLCKCIAFCMQDYDYKSTFKFRAIHTNSLPYGSVTDILPLYVPYKEVMAVDNYSYYSYYNLSSQLVF